MFTFFFENRSLNIIIKSYKIFRILENFKCYMKNQKTTDNISTQKYHNFPIRYSPVQNNVSDFIFRKHKRSYTALYRNLPAIHYAQLVSAISRLNPGRSSNNSFRSDALVTLVTLMTSREHSIPESRTGTMRERDPTKLVPVDGVRD